jgi:hypothetical protein
MVAVGFPDGDTVHNRAAAVGQFLADQSVAGK